MKYFVTIIFLFSTSVFADEYLQRSQIKFNNPEYLSLKDEGGCLEDEKFKPIRNGPDNIFVHIISLGYKYDGKCNAAGGSLALYLKDDKGYKLIFDENIPDPQKYPSANYFNYTHNNQSIPIIFTDHSSDGNASFCHRTAYLLTDDYKMATIDKAPIEKWVAKVLKKGERADVDWCSIDFTENSINLFIHPFKVKDNYRHPSGKKISAKLKFVGNAPNYQLKIAETYDPGKSRYFNDRGLAKYHKQHHEEAVKFFKKAISVNPKNWESWSNLGLSLIKLKKFRESIKASMVVINSKVTRKREKGNAAYNVALAYEKFGDKNKAQEFYKKSIEYEYKDSRLDALQKLVYGENNPILKVKKTQAVSLKFLDRSPLVLNKIGKTKILNVETKYRGNSGVMWDNKKYNFKSSNENIVTIDKNGKVTSQSVGTAVITVSKDEVKASLPVVVEIKEINGR